MPYCDQQVVQWDVIWLLRGGGGMVLSYQGLELGMRRVGFRTWGIGDLEFSGLAC